MNRRAFLAAVAGSLTPVGCLQRESLGSLAPGVGSTPDADATPSNVADADRRVSLVGVDDPPADLAFRAEATLPKPTVTADYPATLRVRFVNEGPSREVVPASDSGTCSPFNRAEAVSVDGGLELVYGTDRSASPPDGTHWRWDRSPDDERGYVLLACGATPFAAGEARTYDYLVWDDYATAGYYRPGAYRFETRIGVDEPDRCTTPAFENRNGTTEQVVTEQCRTASVPTGSFTWGFDLRVDSV